MAAIEDIVAWCNAERARLAHRLEELQSGRLRTCDELAQPPGWLAIDTTARSIDLCLQYISELNAIVARHPEAIAVAAPTPAVVPPAAAPPEHPPLQRDAIHSHWLHGWGVVKGTRPDWDCHGAYASRAEAEAEAAKAGEGYYARWGSYNEQTREFTSGPSFSTA